MYIQERRIPLVVASYIPEIEPVQTVLLWLDSKCSVYFPYINAEDVLNVL